MLSGRDPTSLDSFPPHPGLETFLEPAVLTLVPVVLVNRTVPGSAACVGQIPAHGALEETLTALARELTVVFARALISTHDTLDLLLVVVVL